MKLDLSLDISNTAAAGNAVDWVKKSRISAQEEAKRKAEAKQKQLDDEEEDMVLQMQERTYTSADLKGLKIMHSEKDLFDGQEQVILTLADTDILEMDEYGKVIGMNE